MVVNEVDLSEFHPAWNKSHIRYLASIEHLVLHRIGTSVGKTALDIAKFFVEGEGVKYTGGRMPYHFVIRKSGITEQAVKLKYKAPGARKLNRNGVQIACVGDFREEKLTTKQRTSLVALCFYLKQAFPRVTIVGHTAQEGASGDPNKDCPGDNLKAAEIFYSVKERLEYKRKLELLNKGIK